MSFSSFKTDMTNNNWGPVVYIGCDSQRRQLDIISNFQLLNFVNIDIYWRAGLFKFGATHVIICRLSTFLHSSHLYVYYIMSTRYLATA